MDIIWKRVAARTVQFDLRQAWRVGFFGSAVTVNNNVVTGSFAFGDGGSIAVSLVCPLHQV